MAEQITMPKIAMGQTEGQITEWLVEEGSWVEKGQPVMVIETEKVSYEIEAPASGYLIPLISLGELATVGTVVALLASDEGELAQLQAEQGGASAPSTDAETETTLVSPPPPAAPAQAEPPVRRRVWITPVARKMAAQHGVDITRIVGSGPRGRIIKKDIDRSIGEMAAALAPPAPVLRPVAADVGQGMADVRVKAALPFRGMRKAIADNVLNSLAVSAQVSGVYELDMTEIVRLRRKLLQKEEEIGLRITYNDIFVMILARAVRHVPIVNASLIGDEIKIWEDINVAVAVAIERGEYETGLVTPVIHNADRKTLSEIARASRELTQKAHAGRLTAEDMAGGTITVSNVGGLAPGWTISTPIINQPQAMILQPGRIVERPLVRDGEIVIRPIMSLSFTFDHRIMDGAAPLKLMAKLTEYVEDYAYLFL